MRKKLSTQKLKNNLKKEKCLNVPNEFFPHLQFKMMSNCHIFKIRVNKIILPKIKKEKVKNTLFLGKQFRVVCSLNVLCSS